MDYVIDICHPTPADVVFVLDSSVSMTQEDFQKQLDFVANFSGRVPIGPRDFQISVVTFSSEAHLEFYLNQFSDNTSVIEAVRNITFKPGTTRTDLGLETVRFYHQEVVTYIKICTVVVFNDLITWKSSKLYSILNCFGSADKYDKHTSYAELTYNGRKGIHVISFKIVMFTHTTAVETNKENIILH